MSSDWWRVFTQVARDARLHDQPGTEAEPSTTTTKTVPADGDGMAAGAPASLLPSGISVLQHGLAAPYHPPADASSVYQDPRSLESSALEQRSTLQQIATSPEEVARYVDLVEGGFRNRLEPILYLQSGYRLDDPLADYSLAKVAVGSIDWLKSDLFHKGAALKRDRTTSAELREDLGAFAAVPDNHAAYASLNVVETSPSPAPAPGAAPAAAPGTPAAAGASGVSAAKVNPLRIPEFEKMLTQVIFEEKRRGIEPKAGTPHKWSDSFIKQNLARFPFAAVTSKLFLALSTGTTARYMVTGKEVALTRSIIAQKPESVTFAEMFRQSYRLNDGDIYLTLLTMENVLARHWLHPQRANLAVTRRLAPISNETAAEADRFGNWYHLVGIMLYGYAEGGTKATLVADTESLGSHVLSREPEPQEDYINHGGAVLGGALRSIVHERRWEKHVNDPGCLSADRYLHLVRGGTPE